MSMVSQEHLIKDVERNSASRQERMHQLFDFNALFWLPAAICIFVLLSDTPHDILLFS